MFYTWRFILSMRGIPSQCCWWQTLNHQYFGGVGTLKWREPWSSVDNSGKLHITRKKQGEPLLNEVKRQMNTSLIIITDSRAWSLARLGDSCHIMCHDSYQASQCARQRWLIYTYTPLSRYMSDLFTWNGAIWFVQIYSHGNNNT